FSGVIGPRLECDFDRGLGSGFCLALASLLRNVARVDVTEATLLNSTFSTAAATAGTGMIGGCAIAETCAGNHAFGAFRSSRSITGTITNRQIERTKTGDIRLRAGFTFTFNAVRISKSARLYLLRRQIRGRCCRAARAPEFSGLHGFRRLR